MSSIKDTLSRLSNVDGFVGVALVDSDSGMVLGSEVRGSLNIAVAAAGTRPRIAAFHMGTAVPNNLALVKVKGGADGSVTFSGTFVDVVTKVACPWTPPTGTSRSPPATASGATASRCRRMASAAL